MMIAYTLACLCIHSLGVLKQKIEPFVVLLTMRICKTSSSCFCSFKILSIFLDLLLFITIKIVSSVQYNKQCTFSFGTCKWSIGRRWHIISLDNDNKGFSKLEINFFYF
jgi:hypothetical protein